MASKYDAIYYWTGGREVGRWNECMVQRYIDGALTNPEMPRPGESQCDASLRRLRGMGYVAHPGTLAIGPPDGSPSAAEFKALRA